MPYQITGEQRRSIQLGVGRPHSVHPTLPERILDGIPGFLAWLALIMVLFGTLTAPWVVFSAATILAVYTATRMVLGGVANFIGLRRIKQWEATDWRQEYERRAARLTDESTLLAWEDTLHVIVIPNYKEDRDILRATLNRLAESTLARDQIVVMLAMEASEPGATQKAEDLVTEYQDTFRSVLYSLHPKGLSGEVTGKSANENWAARTAKRILVDEQGYDLDRIIVTIADADSLLHPRYLEAVNCSFTTSESRHSSVWQAPIRYHSNVWQIHPSLGIIQAYSAAWELAYLSAPWWDPLPISTYSISLRLADTVGYWDTDVIAEDWHMFIKCFFKRGTNLKLERVFLPFSGASVPGATFWEACKNRYQQSLRHAWGAKEVGYTLGQIIERPEVAPLRGLQIIFRVAHDLLLAGAGWIVMTLGQLLPLLFAGVVSTEISQSFQYSALQISYVVIGVLGFVFWLIDMSIRPKRTHPWTIREVVVTALSFPLLPFLTLLFVALPVLQAQTQLLIGRHLQYKVAPKV